MKIISVWLLTLLSVTANAQSISAGFKAGVQRQFSLVDKFDESNGFSHYFNDVNGPRNTISTELFTRYNLKGRWAFELGVTHKSSEYRSTSNYSEFTNWQYQLQEDRLSVGKVTFTVFNTSVLYNLTGGKTRKLNAYVGLSISPTYTRVVGKEYLTQDEKQIFYPKSLQYQDWDALYGISQSFSYQVTPTLLLMNNISLRVSQEQFMDFGSIGYQAFSFLDFQIGAAYKFNLK